jgi:hypothetical protein
MTAAVPLIPVVDARLGGPLATARAAAVQMSDLLATARLIYSPPLLEAMDRVSYVGVITAIAPGRFAAAINQPPVLSYGAILPVDWLIERVRV